MSKPTLHSYISEMSLKSLVHLYMCMSEIISNDNRGFSAGMFMQREILNHAVDKYGKQRFDDAIKEKDGE